MIPGEIKVNQALGDIELNAGRETKTIQVANHGDRPALTITFMKLMML